MPSFHRLVFIGLVAAAAPWAQPQSNVTLTPLPSAQIAPSNSAVGSDSATQSGLAAPKKNTQKSASVSNVRSTLATGSVPGESQSLCFQPGVGWQRVPQNSVNSTQKTLPVGSSTRTTEVGSSSPGMSQVSRDQCAGIMTNALAPGAVENIIAGERSHATESNIRTTNANVGVQNWLNADTLLNPASNLAATRLTMGLSSRLAGSKHFSQGTAQSSSANSLQEFEGHAYVSSIKLRKMMRSAPDLETRFKLRRLSEDQKRKGGVSTDNRSSFKNKTSQTVPSNGGTNADLGSHPDQ